MRIARIAPLCPVLSLTLLVSGCLSPRTLVPDTRYALQPVFAIEPMAATEDTLGIRPLQVAHPYGTQMAYLGDDFRFGYRPNAEWTEEPGALFTRALTDALAASGRFADVGNAADMQIPTLILTGEIRKFHEDRSQSPSAARCEVRLELRTARRPGLIWAGTLSASVPLAEHGDAAASVAAAMNEAVQQVILSAVEGLTTAAAPQG